MPRSIICFVHSWGCGEPIKIALSVCLSSSMHEHVEEKISGILIKFVIDFFSKKY